MLRFFASFLVALGLFASPIAMAGTHGLAGALQPAAHEMTMDGHCHESQQSSTERHSAATMLCAITCAAIAAAPIGIGERLAHMNDQPMAAERQNLAGTLPDGETPPPRIALTIQA